MNIDFRDKLVNNVYINPWMHLDGHSVDKQNRIDNELPIPLNVLMSEYMDMDWKVGSKVANNMKSKVMESSRNIFDCIEDKSKKYKEFETYNEYK